MAQKKSDKWIPWYFVAFFVFLAVADGIMVYLATSTHTGVVKEQAYEKGLAYNATVQAKAAQDSLGWESSLTLQDEVLKASLTDAAGSPLKVEEVSVHFSRPTQDGHDFTQTLSPTGKGHYTASVEFPLKGQWDATLTAIWKQQPYQKRTRIIVP